MYVADSFLSGTNSSHHKAFNGMTAEPAVSQSNLFCYFAPSGCSGRTRLQEHGRLLTTSDGRRAQS